MHEIKVGALGAIRNRTGQAGRVGVRGRRWTRAKKTTSFLTAMVWQQSRPAQPSPAQLQDALSLDTRVIRWRARLPNEIDRSAKGGLFLFLAVLAFSPALPC